MAFWHSIVHSEMLLPCLFLAAACMSATAAMGATPTPQPTASELRFNPSGKFKIVQFTDTHFHEADEKQTPEQGKAMGDQLIQDIARICLAEKPDLVVFTGDVVITQDPRYWAKLTEPLSDLRIPFAVVLGNHDAEYSQRSNRQIMDLVRKLLGSLSQNGPDHLGAGGNYLLPILSSTGNQSKATLYFLDSGAYSPDKSLGDYAWISFDQITWFRQQVAAQTQSNGDTPLPALAFFHIPLPEYNEVGQHGPVIGDRFEDPCNPKINSGFFAALVETKSVMGCFVGHDHVNDTLGNVRGIALAYGRKTGQFFYHKQESGARVIELTEGQHTFDTWITTADGQKQLLAHWPEDLQPKPEEKK